MTATHREICLSAKSLTGGFEVDHIISNLGERAAQPAKNAQHCLTNRSKTVIIFKNVKHSSVLRSPTQGEGTTGPCRYLKKTEKFEYPAEIKC